MSNVKQVLVIRKDLNMRKGKMCAQAAHASMKAIFEQGNLDLDVNESVLTIKMDTNSPLCKWIVGQFTKITVSVNSEEELLQVYEKAKSAGLIASIIKDNGLTEFSGVPTYTAVAVGPGNSTDIDQITGGLSLL